MDSHAKYLLVALSACTALSCSSSDTTDDSTSSGGTAATSSATNSGGMNATASTAGGAANGGSSVGTFATTIGNGGGTDSGSGGSVTEAGGTSWGGAVAVGTSPGCNSANTTSPCATLGTTCSTNVAGTDRTYYVELPSGYAPGKAYPVIFQFHPWGGSADMAMTMYQLKSKLPDAIYVSPQGLMSGDSPGWANENGQDIEFTKAMLSEVQTKYCVDNTRIFSTGFSYGGMMSFAIGCELSAVFRAIAPMAGSLYSDFNCKGEGPHIAMWGAHGIDDDMVPLEDGQAALKMILKQNHCGSETEPTDPSPCVKYKDCDPGYEVTWCEWDGKHGMPSFASTAVANFFKQF